MKGSSDFQLRIDHFQDELKRRNIKIGLFSRIEADRKILEKLVNHENFFIHSSKPGPGIP